MIEAVAVITTTIIAVELLIRTAGLDERSQARRRIRAAIERAYLARDHAADGRSKDVEHGRALGLRDALGMLR